LDRKLQQTSDKLDRKVQETGDRLDRKVQENGDRLDSIEGTLQGTNRKVICMAWNESTPVIDLGEDLEGPLLPFSSIQFAYDLRATQPPKNLENCINGV